MGELFSGIIVPSWLLRLAGVVVISQPGSQQLLNLLDKMGGDDPYKRDRSSLRLLIVSNPQNPSSDEQDSRASKNYYRRAVLF
jgi:hypothetical protein